MFFEGKWKRFLGNLVFPLGRQARVVVFISTSVEDQEAVTDQLPPLPSLRAGSTASAQAHSGQFWAP